jgi:hypothetical protein
MADIDPQPGEAWVCVNNLYTNAYGNQDYIYGAGRDNPFIVLWLSVGRIGFVCARDGAEPHTGTYPRVDRGWKWLDHFERIWPSVPSWAELEQHEQGRVRQMAEAQRKRQEHHPDDLRAHALKGS